MADNSVLPATGDSIRDKDRSGVKTQIVGLDLTPGGGSETLMNGSIPSTVADGADVALGATSDADTATTVIGRLKKMVALLAGGLPAALTAGGGVKVGVVDSLPAGTNNIGDVDVVSAPGVYDGGDDVSSPTGVLVMGRDASGLPETAEVVDVEVTGGGNGLKVALMNDSGNHVGYPGDPLFVALDSSFTETVNTELTTADLDTGVGTDTRAVVGLVGSKSGGAQLIPGDATAGLKVDLGADNDVTVTGTVATKQTSGTATHTTVAASATSVTLLSSNANRLGATIYNDSTVVLYVKFGATASNSSFIVKMAGGSYYEFPNPCYTGRVDGIWDSASGNARIVELT